MTGGTVGLWDLRQLEAFAAVATGLHSGRAAERLHVAAPTVSELIRRLDLFPAWALSQQQALGIAGISPPAVDLTDTELAASRWAEQRDIAWILLIPSLAAAHTTTVIRPVEPAQLVPFTLQ